MNNLYNYSDEHINAYIDGELDNEERAQFLFNEQEDALLASRVHETRMLKEKIQLAYADVVNVNDTKRSFKCIEFFNRHRAIAASLFVIVSLVTAVTLNMESSASIAMARQLMASTQPITANMIDNAIGTNQHVVIHVSQYQQNKFGDTIHTLEALLKDNSKNGSFSVELVANGQGLKLLDKTSSIYAEQLNTLTEKFSNLKVVACAKSLAKLASEGDPIQLMSSIMISPSAAEQIAKRTEQGWLYLKV